MPCLPIDAKAEVSAWVVNARNACPTPPIFFNLFRVTQRKIPAVYLPFIRSQERTVPAANLRSHGQSASGAFDALFRPPWRHHRLLVGLMADGLCELCAGGVCCASYPDLRAMQNKVEWDIDVDMYFDPAPLLLDKTSPTRPVGLC